MTYTLRCPDCGFSCKSDMATIREEARIHEDDAKHRVQVWPTSPIVRPLPRSMWA